MEFGHGGQQIVDAALAAGVNTAFTLSGAHIFPFFDAAVGGRARVESVGDRRTAERYGPIRLVDTRHEQTAAFAAEATGKLTRKPGLAVVTAGPGVTNTVSAVASAWFNGSPMVVLGGRAPNSRWGQGALQELDHPPLLTNITKAAWTTGVAGEIRSDADRAFALAGSPHFGPVFWDVPMDVLFSASPRDAYQRGSIKQPLLDPDPEELLQARRLMDQAHRPVVVMGGGVWMADAVEAAREFVISRNIPAIANGMGRGVLAANDPHLVSRSRSAALKGSDLVIVVGAPLDFRLGFGLFGSSTPAKVIHLVDAPDQRSTSEHVTCTVVGALSLVLEGLSGGQAADPLWAKDLRDQALAAISRDLPDLASEAEKIHPARVYGEVLARMTEDSVIIGDGGDFVSFAGRYVEPARPGRWLDPGPYGCLGTGPGYALAAGVAHAGSPIWLLMGDGAAGFSLMDVDSLVRHKIPAVMVVGNNAAWALEKQPMQMLYGYDVLADLRPTRYDEVVIALGGGGETVTDPRQIGPAMDRAMASGLPYLVNVMTDPNIAYPRTTLGI